MTPRVKWQLLGGLILIWGILMFFQAIEDTEPKRMPLQFKTGQTIKKSPRGSQTPLFALAKSPSTRAKKFAFQKPRNIFASLNYGLPERKGPFPTKPLSPSASPNTKGRMPSTPVQSAADRAAQQAKQKLKQYRFLGYLTKEGENQIFLSNGQAIYIVKQGDTLEGDISIRAIEPDSIVLSKPIRETGTTVEETLALTKESGGA